ncbi:thiamine pyrophosphate-dependent dehydrogenase E1 component subunit alpha [Chloroflexota bacterium]
MEIDSKKLINLYRTMLAIRRFEERISQEVLDGNIRGYVHSYIGQEAIATGVCSNLLPGDRIVSNHRGHGHCIAKGADIKRMMAEIYGRRTGYCKGKGGSMHIADFSIGMLGANGIVGAGLPIAIGAATAAQLEDKNQVAVVFFGDGGCHEGEFHEAMNLASIWKLPLVFICENNFYAFNTPAQYAIAIDEIYKRATAYSMPGIAIDGNDVIAVYETAKEVIQRAREKGGPTLLECKTYRQHSHFESTILPDLRPAEEIKTWKQKCPIASMERRLLEAGVLSKHEIKVIDNQVMTQIRDAINYALESPFPDPEDTLEDVFLSEDTAALEV